MTVFALGRIPVTAVAVAALLSGGAALAPPRALRWAGDSEGGAPFVEADPNRPDTVVGFDVDLAALVARGRCAWRSWVTSS